MVLNTGPLNWEFSALTTRALLQKKVINAINMLKVNEESDSVTQRCSVKKVFCHILIFFCEFYKISQNNFFTQNISGHHWVTLRSIEPFMLSRFIKSVPVVSGNLEVKTVSSKWL